MKSSMPIYSAVAISLLFSFSLSDANTTKQISDKHSFQLGFNYFWLKQNNNSKGKIDTSYLDGYFTKIIYKDPLDKNKGGNNPNTPDVENSTNVTILRKVTKTRERNIDVTPKIDVFPQFTNADINIPAIKPFEKRLIIIPKKPAITSPSRIAAVDFSLAGVSFNPDPTNTSYSFWRAAGLDDIRDYGEITQVNLEKGTFFKDRNSVSIKNYKASEAVDPDDVTKAARTTVLDNTAGIDTAINNSPQADITSPNIYEGIADGNYEANDPNAATDERRVFYTLMNAPYTYFGKDVRVYANSFGGYIINLETQGLINYNLEAMLANGVFGADRNADTNEIYKKIKAYRQYASKTALEDATKDATLYFENKGLVEVGEDMASFLVVTTHTDGESRINIIDNSGKIVFLPRAQFTTQSNDTNERLPKAIFYHSPDTDITTTHNYINSGEVELYGYENSLFLVTANNTDYLEQTDFKFINSGNVKIFGANNVGVGVDDKIIKPYSGFFFFNPIHINSDKSIGLYSVSDTLNRDNHTYSSISAVLGDTNAIPEYSLEKPDGTIEKKRAQSNLPGNDEKWVEGAVGIFNKPTNNTGKMDALVKTDITIEKFAKNSIGAYSNLGKLILTPLTDALHADFETNNAEIAKTITKDKRKHKITINGGEGNTALYAAGENANTELEYHGDVVVKKSELALAGGNENGKNNIALSSSERGNIKFSGNLIVGSETSHTPDAIGVYAKGGNVVIRDYKDVDPTITDDTKVDINIISTDINNERVYGVYAEQVNGAGGVVEFKDGINPTIRMSAEKDDKGKPISQGVAMFAINKGKITAKKSNIDVNGIATALAVREYGYIDAQGSNITYDGEGYAIYSDGKTDPVDTNIKSTMDLSNSTINLKGKSAGLGLDYIQANDTYTLRGVKLTGSDIIAHSNDVVFFTVTNLPSKKTSELNRELVIEDRIEGWGTYKIVRKPGAELARLASIDGLADYRLDTDIHKELAAARGNTIAAMTNDEERRAFNFSRNIIAQRAKLTLDENKRVTAHLDTNMLKNLDMQMTSGIDVSSSGGAASKAETGITLKPGSSVSADRIDGTDNGGVGLFTDYGNINIEAGAKVEVEKSGMNAPNENAVGVYGINSNITNSGKIDVGSNNSIGILSNTYKILADGTIKYSEFGNQADSGKTSIQNNGEITMQGDNATGIYSNNNSVDIPAPDTPKTNAENTATNSGTITINGKNGSGMVASGSTITNAQGGIITLEGSNSGGMYGKEQSNKNKNIEANVVVNDGKIIMKGAQSVGMTDKNTNPNSKIELGSTGEITAQADSSTAIQGTNIDVKNGAKISLKDNSFGVYAYDNATVNIGNLNEFTLGENSVYVSLKNSPDNNDKDVVLNYNHAGQIDLKSKSVGILSRNTAADAISRTKININNGSFRLSDNSMAIYSNDKKSDIVVANGVNFRSAGDRVFGIYSEGGTITNSANMDLSLDKNGATSIGNVAMFMKGNGSITNNAEIIVGGSNEKKHQHSVAIGLEGDGNIINRGNVKITGKNSIGIYVKGANSKVENHADIDIEAGATGSIGIFADAGATVENRGNINVKASDAIGVFLKAGSVLKNYGNFVVTGQGSFATMLERDDQIINEAGTNPVDASKIEKTSAKVTVTEIVKATGESIVDIDKNGLTITNNGKEVNNAEIAYVNTPAPVVVPVRNVDLTIDNVTTKIDPLNFGFTTPRSSTDGLNMYVDTSGIQATNPIRGLANLGANLPKINIFIGAEAAKYTNSKYIVIKKEIIKPFIDEILNVNPDSVNFVSGSLTWEANVGYNENATDLADRFDSFVLTKKPYRDVGANANLNPIYDGLDQRYTNRQGSADDRIFNIINNLGANERDLFNRAVSQIAGSEYANTQERVKSSADIYNREFYEVMDWDTNTTDTTKFKLFGESSISKFKPSGYTDYNKKAKGIFVLHTKDLDANANSHGLFAGVAKESYDFKNHGRSREKASTAHLGYYVDNQIGKSETKWLTKASLNYGVRKMDRKFVVVNDLFRAKGRYETYGIEWDNKFYRPYEFNNGITLKPYAGAELSYTHIKDVKEKGDLALQIDMKRYYGIKPNAGLEVKFNKYIDSSSFISATLDTKLFYEAGTIYPSKNGSRISNTNTDYYKLDSDKNRLGAEVSGAIKYEEKAFGASIKAGANSRNKNTMIGIDLRVKF